MKVQSLARVGQGKAGDSGSVIPGSRSEPITRVDPRSLVLRSPRVAKDTCIEKLDVAPILMAWISLVVLLLQWKSFGGGVE